jgi:hypothetical protein
MRSLAIAAWALLLCSHGHSADRRITVQTFRLVQDDKSTKLYLFRPSLAVNTGFWLSANSDDFESSGDHGAQFKWDPAASSLTLFKSIGLMHGSEVIDFSGTFINRVCVLGNIKLNNLEVSRMHLGVVVEPRGRSRRGDGQPVRLFDRGVLTWEYLGNEEIDPQKPPNKDAGAWQIDR